MTRIQKVGEKARLEMFRAVIDSKVEPKIKGAVPWTYCATPSTFRQVYGVEGDAYAIAFDTTRLDASKVIGDAKLAHDIQTALKERTGNINLRFRWVNSDGACAFIDERYKGFPERIPLPKPPAGGYMIPLGVNRAGQARWVPLAEAGHIIVGGITRGGKTTGCYSWFQALIAQHGPEELQLVIADGKRFEFNTFNGSVYLPSFMRGRIAGEVEELQAACEALWLEIEKRKLIFEQHKVYSLERLTKKTGIRLPVFVLFIDEYSIFLNAGFDDRVLMDILRLGAGLGVYVINSTQRADVETIKKTNFSTIVSYRLANSGESQVLFGKQEPYNILKGASQGELVALGIGLDYEHLKGFFVNKDEVDAVADDLPAPVVVRTPPEPAAEGVEVDLDQVAYQVVYGRGLNHLKSKFGIGSGRAQRLQKQAERFKRVLGAMGYEVVRSK